MDSMMPIDEKTLVKSEPVKEAGDISEFMEVKLKSGKCECVGKELGEGVVKVFQNDKKVFFSPLGCVLTVEGVGSVNSLFSFFISINSWLLIHDCHQFI